MDSGLSDRGDRGDNGLLLSKYSSKYLQVHTSTHALTQTHTINMTAHTFTVHETIWCVMFSYPLCVVSVTKLRSAA